jgi:hypothetical protein
MSYFLNVNCRYLVMLFNEIKVSAGIEDRVFRSCKTLHLVKKAPQLATNDVQKVWHLASKFDSCNCCDSWATVKVENNGLNELFTDAGRGTESRGGRWGGGGGKQVRRAGEGEGAPLHNTQWTCVRPFVTVCIVSYIDSAATIFAIWYFICVICKLMYSHKIFQLGGMLHSVSFSPFWSTI